MKKEDGDRARSRTKAEEKRSSFTLVDSHKKRQDRLRRQLIRLGPMASLAMGLATLPVCLFVLLEFMGLIPAGLVNGGGIQAYALNAFLFYGFIPLMATSLALALFRPPLQVLLGDSPGLPVLLASPALGFFLGSLVHTGLQLMASYFPGTNTWLAIPDLWQKGALYLGRSTVMTLTVLAFSVLMPASTLELLHRGLVLPAFVGFGGSMVRIILPSLLAASLPLDLPGFAPYLVLALMASWVRLTSGSLLASALTTAGYGLAMLYARPLTTALSRLVFGMPLIDNLKLRLYLVSLTLILLVLLLIPRAIIEGTSPAYQKRLRPGARGEGTGQGISSSNRLVLLLCLAASWACLYFLVFWR